MCTSAAASAKGLVEIYSHTMYTNEQDSWPECSLWKWNKTASLSSMFAVKNPEQFKSSGKEHLHM